MRSLLTSPLGMLYKAITILRNWGYDEGILKIHRESIPVISVGNITVGGNGKTPFCHVLVALLKSMGWRPVILSRGYKGRVKGPYEVNKDDTHLLVGDEPLMMALHRQCPVVVARDRVKGVRFIVAKSLGDIVVLDDGFQHRRLWRDVDLVCCSVSSKESIRSFFEGRLLPQGMLREDRKRALQRATALIMTHQREYDEKRSSLFSSSLHCDIPLFETWVEPKEFVSVKHPHLTRPFEGDWSEVELIGVCGLARPEGFFKVLAHAHGKHLRTYSYPDHSSIPISFFKALCNADSRSVIVMTEKDMVKLRTISSAIPDNVFWLRIVTHLRDSYSFGKFLASSIQSKKSFK
jgi:tetraacyldisaccharide 4'-kinase